MPLENRRLARAAVAAACLLSILPFVASAAQAVKPPKPAPFKVGAANTNADPDSLLCLGGYDILCQRRMTGIKDPLTTSAIAITGAGNETILIAKTTAIGLFASYKPEQGATGIYDIRQRIAEETGIPSSSVIVTSDHSHAAPDTIGIWGGVDRAYMEQLADSVVDAAVNAYRSRLPARISVAAVQGPDIDTSYSKPPTDHAAADEEFRVLFAETPAGKAISTLINYAPHATVCGECDDLASGDWTAWAAQEVERRGMGIGIGFVGALGATDWRKTGDEVEEREAEARTRINTLLDAALAAKRPVVGNAVRADVTFINEPLAQPILAANLLPGGVLTDGSADIRIDRNTAPPWLTGNLIGTYVGALRIGDVFLSTFPGEPFPQLQDALRDGGVKASEHFLLGAANDFLGYMVANDEQYRQTFEEGATYLPAGCPEQAVTHQLPGEHDGACPDHWTLMVSPTIGTHAVCTIQDAADRIGFTTGTRSERCDGLTALDGQNAPAEIAPPGQARAGVAKVDAPWHIGASGGQFGEDEPPFSEDAIDPHMQSTKKRPAYGLGSNVTVRALVVEDGEGEKVAIVSHDLYLPQDLLTRRIASLVESQTGIPSENVMVTASHNHNSPYYSTPGWGTWIFQDVFDLRFFEYMARQSVEAVVKANDGLVPVRMGGETTTFNEITSHTYGPKVADDGTPAGQPYDHTTGEVSVVAFDDVSSPSAPKPLATWVVFGVHPEWTWGYDLINGDISHATMRIVDREVGGVTVWSGREIGTSGPHKDRRAHEPEARREYQDNGFAQIDRAARLLGDAVERSRSNIAAGTPDNPDRYAAFETNFDVAAVSQRFAPASTRPYPGVSNCNTAAWFHGDPRIPILGLPDCSPVPPNDVKDETPQAGPIYEALEEAKDTIGPIGGQIYDQLKAAGVPVPDSISPTKLTGVEETAAVHLMAIKLGDIGITACPCEQFTDTALNIESRIDKVRDNLWLGWNWADQRTPADRDWCVQNEDTTWTCADPTNPPADLAPITDLEYRRMVAQIENDATGWELDELSDTDPSDDIATLGAEAEPTDPAKIKGNFSHEEFPDAGFSLPIAVGMANDYWGYIPEYREYRSHDHYRKALSGLGPHGADFLATRLSRLAVSLNGGPGVALRPLDLAFQAESARAQAVAAALGETGAAYEQAYQATLPADGGDPAIISQPNTVTRMDGAHVRWVGGSTYADMPKVVVQRRTTAGEWIPYADTNGDVQLTVKMPRPDELQNWRAGEFVWEWTAAFEVFSSDVALPDASGIVRRQTPPGTYRFIIEGQRRIGPPGTLEDYRIEGEPFKVKPWDGITVNDLQIDPASGVASFEIGPRNTHTYDGGKVEHLGPIDLPDTYDSPFRLIDGTRRVFTYGLEDSSRHQVYCSFCSFRPWADTSDVVKARVMIRLPSGKQWSVPASFDSTSGRWETSVAVPRRASAWVPPGAIADSFGNINGSRSAVVRR